MRGLLERFSRRHEYRWASAVLVAASVLSLCSLLLVDEPTWMWRLLAFVLVLTCDAALVVLTYFRLRDAALSVWWLLPMVVVFHVGPSWPLAAGHWGAISFSPTGLVAFIPVIIGWFAAPKAESEPVPGRPWSD